MQASCLGNDLRDNLDMRDKKKKKAERFICEGFDADELLFLGERGHNSRELQQLAGGIGLAFRQQARQQQRLTWLLRNLPRAQVRGLPADLPQLNN